MTLRIDIINQALLELGDQPVTEDAPPGDGYVLQFDTHIGALISRYPWTFQSRLRQLGRLTAAPEAHWKYAFALPSDRLGPPRAVYPEKDECRPISDYELLEDRLLCDEPELWARYPFVITPSVWPAHFKSLAILVMKAQFALTVREDASLHFRLSQVAFGPPEYEGQGGLFGECKAIDAGSRPSRVVQIGSNPLTAVRL
jgi:hypothetical protein